MSQVLPHRFEECAVLFREEWEVITGSTHTPWQLLPQEDRDETRVAVKTTAWIVAGLLDSRAFTEEVAASLVHESWKSRNWQSDARLLVPYSQLSELEKEKDRALVRIVHSVFTEESDSGELQ